MNNRQTAETAGATADGDYSENAGQVATDAASTGHFQTATPIAPKPGELSISQLTERVILGYWITVPYVQGTLIGKMYEHGPQEYYQGDAQGGNGLAHTELPRGGNLD